MMSDEAYTKFIRERDANWALWLRKVAMMRAAGLFLVGFFGALITTLVALAVVLPAGVGTWIDWVLACCFLAGCISAGPIVCVIVGLDVERYSDGMLGR